MTGDWAELCPELLYLVLKELNNISDCIRFRSVCKQWRSVVGPTDSPPLIPWLLQPGPDTTPESNKEADSLVYSLASNTTFQIKLSTTYQGYNDSSMGYLLLHNFINHKPPYLFNPVTGTKLDLPFPKDARYYRMVYLSPDINISNLKNVKDGVHLVVSGTEFHGREIKSQFVWIWRSDDNKFSTLKIPCIPGRTVRAYYKGKLFFYQYTPQSTIVFDIATGTEINIPNPDPTYLIFYYFAEAPGDLLGITLSFLPDDITQFRVYRLEHTDNFAKCTWIKMNGIGDSALFIQNPVLCLNTKDLKGFRGNCIYYCLPGSNEKEYVFRYDIETGTSEMLLDRAAHTSTWFVPALS